MSCSNHLSRPIPTVNWVRYVRISVIEGFVRFTPQQSGKSCFTKDISSGSDFCLQKGFTALHLASQEGHADTVAALLTIRNVNVKTGSSKVSTIQLGRTYDVTSIFS